MDWSNRFTIGGFTVTYCTFQMAWEVIEKQGDYEVAFRWFPSKQNQKIFALDGSQGNCNVFIFLEIFEDMESMWKMELSPKEPSL